MLTLAKTTSSVLHIFAATKFRAHCRVSLARLALKENRDYSLCSRNNLSNVEKTRERFHSLFSSSVFNEMIISKCFQLFSLSKVTTIFSILLSSGR